MRAMLLLQVLTVSFIMVTIKCDFLPQRLAIIDSNKKTQVYIVRGNLPIMENKFQIKQLKGNLTILTGLNRYKLIVISLLNLLTPKETKNRYIQQKYFDKNEMEGEYRNKMVLGSLLDPSSFDLTRNAIKKMHEYLSIDDMDNFISGLRNEIKMVDGPKIIYIHCSAGVDRTGYVAGAYGMKYLNKRFDQVLYQNIKILAGVRTNMHFNSFNGLQWFCLSLHKHAQQCRVGSY